MIGGHIIDYWLSSIFWV